MARWDGHADQLSAAPLGADATCCDRSPRAEASAGLRGQLVQQLPALRRFTLSLSGSQADAEDLAQAAIERALRAEHRWREGSRLDSWLYRIAQNLWRDQQRAARRRPLEIREALEVTGEDGRETCEKRAELQAVRRAFASLSREHQAVIALVILQGASYREAANRLGLPEGTVMSRLARARAALAAEI